jgi:hypothetical protein
MRMGRGKLACVAAVAICLLGTQAEARHRGGHRHRTTTTSTLPPGSPPGFSTLDSAFGALLDEVNAEPLSGHIRSGLLKQIGHAQADVARAESLLSTGDRTGAKAALQHARRWMINLHFRVGSNSGRRGGAQRTNLFPLVDPILSDLQALRRSF